MSPYYAWIDFFEPLAEPASRCEKGFDNDLWRGLHYVYLV